VRLPPFWAERPAVWFAQAEAQFFLAGVNSAKTKLLHVISQLDHRYATEVEDIINSSPERNPYTKLRNELVQRLPPSRATHPPATHARGDGRPQAVPAPETAQEPCTRRARKLPAHHLVQPATPPQHTDHPRRSAGVQLGRRSRCADRISEMAPQPALASVGPPPNTTLLQVIDLSRQVAALSAEQDRLHTSFRDPPPSAPGTLVPAQAVRTPATGICDQTAIPPSEATPHPPSAGTIAASGKEPKSVPRPAPTASRENQRSRHHRRHMSALQQAASSLRIGQVNGSS
jgi:hypothetical protein